MFQIHQSLQADAAALKDWKQTWMHMQTQLLEYVSNPEVWIGLFMVILKIILIYIGARLVVKLANSGLQHLLTAREKKSVEIRLAAYEDDRQAGRQYCYVCRQFHHDLDDIKPI